PTPRRCPTPSARRRPRRPVRCSRDHYFPTASRHKIACLRRLNLCDSASARGYAVMGDSVELALFGRARQRRGRAGRVDRRGDPVEVARAHLTLVLGGGVTPLLGGELALLQFHVRAHLIA